MFDKKRNKLVEKLKKNCYILSKDVEIAFLETPREKFVIEKFLDSSYIDSPLEIGNGQTISAPHMVAIMCEALKIKPGQKILEIGSGSGYHAAIVSKLVGKKGHVYTIERIPALADFAKKNLKSAEINNVTVEIGDGSCGLKKFAPYDIIYVTCAAPDVSPSYYNQLKNNGKLLIPIGRQICELMLFEKLNKNFVSKNLGGCAFVPLIGKYGH